MKIPVIFLSFFFLSAAHAAIPEVKKSSCVVEMKEVDTAKSQLPATSSSHSYDSYEFTWLKNAATFSIESRNVKSTRFADWEFNQTLRQNINTSSGALGTDDVETKYFFDPRGIKEIKGQRRLQTEANPLGQTVTDITFTDASRNFAKLYVSQVTKPDGSIEKVSERRDPSPVGEDGIQITYKKTTCREEIIPYENAKFDSRARKLKTKTEAFSRTIDSKSDPELITDWRKLFKVSDFRSTGGSSGGGSEGSGGGSRCERLKPLFDRCIYHRANCWEYNAGGACYGVPNMWGQCTGIRPPVLGCPGM